MTAHLREPAHLVLLLGAHEPMDSRVYQEKKKNWRQRNIITERGTSLPIRSSFAPHPAVAANLDSLVIFGGRLLSQAVFFFSRLFAHPYLSSSFPCLGWPGYRFSSHTRRATRTTPSPFIQTHQTSPSSPRGLLPSAPCARRNRKRTCRSIEKREEIARGKNIKTPRGLSAKASFSFHLAPHACRTSAPPQRHVRPPILPVLPRLRAA